MDRRPIPGIFGRGHATYAKTSIAPRHRTQKGALGMDIHFSVTGLFFTLQLLSDIQRTLYQPVQKETAVSETAYVYRARQLRLPAQIPGFLELDSGHNCVHSGDLHSDGHLQSYLCHAHHIPQTV
jgi:hypothetical protein